MTKNEIKSVTAKWFKSRGFQKNGIEFNYPFDKFDLVVLFYKDRFDEYFSFEVGFRLKGENATIMVNGHAIQAWGNKRTIIRDELFGYYYEKWEEGEYIKCLQEIYDKYIKPYFEKEWKYLRLIANDPTCNGQFLSQEKYTVHPHAIKVILNEN